MYLRIFHLIYGASSNCHIEKGDAMRDTVAKKNHYNRGKMPMYTVFHTTAYFFLYFN